MSDMKTRSSSNNKPCVTMEALGHDVLGMIVSILPPSAMGRLGATSRAFRATTASALRAAIMQETEQLLTRAFSEERQTRMARLVGCPYFALPADLTGLGDRAFSSCSSLASVALPEGLTSIDGYAFYGCSALASVALPEGLTSIGYRTF